MFGKKGRQACDMRNLTSEEETERGRRGAMKDMT